MAGLSDAGAGSVAAGRSGLFGVFRWRRRGAARARPKDRGRSFAVTFLAVVLLAAFISPLIRSITFSIKTPQQIAAVDSPLWPESPQTFTYLDRDYPMYIV